MGKHSLRPKHRSGKVADRKNSSDGPGEHSSTTKKEKKADEKPEK